MRSFCLVIGGIYYWRLETAEWKWKPLGECDRSAACSSSWITVRVFGAVREIAASPAFGSCHPVYANGGYVYSSRGRSTKRRFGLKTQEVS